MASAKVNHYLARLKELEQRKQPWLPHFQAIAEVFLTRKSDFTHTANPGEFLQENVFDNTGQFALNVFASVCMSMLWPDAARTFNIVPAEPIKGQAGVETYFRKVTAKLHAAMDMAEAGLSLAFMEYFLDEGGFGTSGVGTFEGDRDDLPLRYESWDVKAMCISENMQGFVDTIFFKMKYTVRQIVEEYGTGKRGDRISEVVREKYASGKLEETVEVLKVLEPKAAEVGKRGAAAMSVRTCHIDLTNQVFMREGAYEELPVAVGRMYKRVGEEYGRSPAMVALPDAISLNALTEGILVATEKQLDPPLALLDDGRLGGTVVDTSAGAFNVFNAAGRLGGEKPIFPLFTVGEMQSSEKLAQWFEQKIMQAFQLDRLLDLNNKTMMTAYETSIRNRLRGEGTGSIFSRQIVEVITPTIRRSYNIMHRRGEFGEFPGIPANAPGLVRRRKWKQLTGTDDLVVPDIVRRAVEAGLEVYEIEYISPAQRFMQAEKLQGIITTLDTALAIAAVKPEIMDNFDFDDIARLLQKYAGAPVSIVRTVQDLKDVRAAIAERQNAAAALQAGGAMADIQAKSAQALAARQSIGTR